MSTIAAAAGEPAAPAQGVELIISSFWLPTLLYLVFYVFLLGVLGFFASFCQPWGKP